MSKSAKAFAAGMARAQEKAAKMESEGEQTTTRLSGNWSRMAMMEMERSLNETKEMHSVMQKTLIDGILNGNIPIEIPIEQIVDELGTDRILETPDAEGEAESFQSLVENIRTRGLRVPLRVRPKNPDWRPSKDEPRKVGDTSFVLQSGRRRLAACKHLGITPVAFISLPDGDNRFSDLQERFFENAARKNLTLVEKLYSIGLLARDLKDMSQEQIADALGVGQSYVSRGLAVVENFDRLKEDLDLSKATSRDIDNTLKVYRKGTPASKTPDAVRKRKTRAAAVAELPFKKKVVGKASVSLKTNAQGERVLALKSRNLDDAIIEKILDIIASQDSNPDSNPDGGAGEA
jgi:ParB/RepB/Spo0J family partition protein